MYNEQLARMAQSYVGVYTDMNLGSGTVVGHKGRRSYILTCHHVVNRPLGSRIKYHDKCPESFGPAIFTEVPAAVEESDLAMDLALLSVPRLARPTIDISDGEPCLYSRGLVMGTAAGLYGTAGEVVLCGMEGSNGDDLTGDLYQYVGLSVGGVSGGLLCDADGALIGVPSQGSRENDLSIQNMGFAVPLPLVEAFLGLYLPAGCDR